jgi:hypothetical protein
MLPFNLSNNHKLILYSHSLESLYDYPSVSHILRRSKLSGRTLFHERAHLSLTGGRRHVHKNEPVGISLNYEFFVVEKTFLSCLAYEPTQRNASELTKHHCKSQICKKAPFTTK